MQEDGKLAEVAKDVSSNQSFIKDSNLYFKNVSNATESLLVTTIKLYN